MTGRYELIDYAAAPGRLADLVRAYGAWLADDREAEHGLVGVWTCEFGDLNRLLALRAVSDGTAAAPDLTRHGQIAVERKHLWSARPLRLDGPANVIEFRTYFVQPGARERYLERMLPALAIRERHSRNIGVWTPVGGDPDKVLHMWGYADIPDRMRARNAAFADEDWRVYLATVYPLLARMNSQILVPTGYSPLR